MDLCKCNGKNKEILVSAFVLGFEREYENGYGEEKIN